MTASFPKEIRIATRESKLALWQAEHVAKLLRQHYPEINIRLIPMTTKGDQLLNSSLSKIGGKGLFIKELELAMQEGIADIAVHSMKDVGIEFPEGFTLAAILEREDPSDAFVSNHYTNLEALPKGAKVGTCSLRRRMQITALRPDLELLDLRGNVQTRLSKLDNGQFDAIILASAGLKRLDLAERITAKLSFDQSLPAIGQGAIGIECHQKSPILPLLTALNHAPTELCVRTERIINERLQGSCQVPLAAFATLDQNNIYLRAKIGTPDGKNVLNYQDSALQTDASTLGHAAADHLLAQGAQEILNNLITAD
ncbi:hydroxymethylbilane synthase [Suttonella ornithocola]|uniref:Porphobilinogen deaminase n=1 Tax=Suttonella ornithocola TaxID=279832 RepID=A0A380MXE5_9GAMM|nr:hydroxymethylbilane synthase [Suttonella ornithocola]SUO97245.1 Porphobilinogen deaminase [Suttonella ornithocola]